MSILFRQRAGEMEEELEKSKQSYQTQISAHEKKAHNNWVSETPLEPPLKTPQNIKIIHFSTVKHM